MRPQFLFAGPPTGPSVPGAEEMHRRYGEPNIEFFDVRSGIAIAVEYGPDRLACEVSIGHKQSLLERQSPPPPISSRVVTELLQQLVPVAARGKQISSNSVQIEDNVQLKTDYDNVSIRRLCSAPSCLASDQDQDLRTLIVFNRSACTSHFK